MAELRRPLEIKRYGRYTALVQVRLDPTEREQLHAIAKRQGTCMTAIIRGAVNEYVGDWGERAVFLGLPDKQS